MVDLVSHMTLERDLSDLEMTWSFLPWVPMRHDARAWGNDAKACGNDVGKVQECDRKIFGDC